MSILIVLGESFFYTPKNNMGKYFGVNPRKCYFFNFFSISFLHCRNVILYNYPYDFFVIYDNVIAFADGTCCLSWRQVCRRKEVGKCVALIWLLGSAPGSPRGYLQRLGTAAACRGALLCIGTSDTLSHFNRRWLTYSNLTLYILKARFQFPFLFSIVYLF